MLRNTNFTRLLWIVFLACAGIGLFFQFNYHKFLNFDTLAYINVGELYAAGDLQHAINGCWSPFYSWLLGICQFAGLPLLPVCYVINFLAAGLCFYWSMKIAGQYLSGLFYYAFNFLSLSFFLFYAMSTLTPDLISMAFLLLLVKQLGDEKFYHSRKIAVVMGVAGAVSYFAKLYNFPMLNLFFAALLIYQFARKDPLRMQKIRFILKAYGIFLVISLVWICVLSVHEKKLVFATTGNFTHNLVSPYYNKPYPIYTGLHAPPFDGAYAFFIDPTHLLDEYNWSPFESGYLFNHQLRLVGNSLEEFYFFLDTKGIKLTLLLVVILVLFLNRKKIAQPMSPPVKRILLFFMVYPLLYLPIFMVDRYILICIFLFHLLLFYLLQNVSGLFSRKVLYIVAASIVALSIIPLIMAGRKKIAISSGEYSYYKAFYHQLPELSFLQNQRVAADGLSALESAQLCYHLNCRYYCTWVDQQYASLQHFSIQYYIAKSPVNFSFLELKKQVAVNDQVLYVYTVKP